MHNTRTPIFAAAGVVVFCVLLIFVLVLPKLGQVSSAKDQLAEAQAEQQTLESRQGALEDLQRKAPENRALIKEVAKRIPPTADESGLLLLLHNAVIDSGLNLATMAPTPPVLNAAGDLSVIVVAISADGTYSQITQFAQEIETLPRAAQITSLTLAPSEGVAASGSPVLTATIQLNAYTTDLSAGPGSAPGPTTEATG